MENDNEENKLEDEKNNTNYNTNYNTNSFSKKCNKTETKINTNIQTLPPLSPPHSRSLKISYNPTTTNIFNSKNLDAENLKQELSNNSNEINAKKLELQELKIKFNKLFEDNKNNKSSLAKILGIELDKQFTKEELVDKLEHCKPTEEEKKY